MYDYLDSIIKSSWMYMHDKKCDLLWQTRIITEVYFFSSKHVLTNLYNTINSLLNPIRSKNCPLTHWIPIERWPAPSAIKDFKGCNLDTCMITVVIGEFRKRQVVFPCTLPWQGTCAKQVFESLNWSKYALEEIIKLLFISLFHDKCFLFMLYGGGGHPIDTQVDL